MAEFGGERVWLAVLLVVVVTFHRQIRQILSRMARMNVAGASFEFSDPDATLASYAGLTDVLLSILGERNAAEALPPVISMSTARRLNRIVLRIMKEAQFHERHVESFKNIGVDPDQEGS